MYEGREVVLPTPDLNHAISVGIKRRMENIAKQWYGHTFQDEQDPWGRNIEGACAEKAAADYLGIPWPAYINTFNDPDKPDLGTYIIDGVEWGIQVRGSPQATKTPRHGLMIKDRDHPDHLYVLVDGLRPRYRVIGVMSGTEVWSYGDRLYLRGGPSTRMSHVRLREEKLDYLVEVLRDVSRAQRSG